MTYKTFFFNYLKTDIQSKTGLSQKIFPKTLIRKRYKPGLGCISLEAVCLLDTDGFFSLKGLLKNNVGNYAFLKNKNFSHNKLKKLKIKSFFFSENYLTKIQTLSTFLSSLKLLQMLKTPQLTIILYPVKGGYKVFSQGLLGFLPKSHYKFYFFKKIKLFRFSLKNFIPCRSLSTTSLKNARYLLFFFSVIKMLCIIKKAVLYNFLRRQNTPIIRQFKKYFRYKPAKNCFSFKFIFVSPFIKSLSAKKKLLSSKNLKYSKSFKTKIDNFNLLVALNTPDLK